MFQGSLSNESIENEQTITKKCVRNNKKERKIKKKRNKRSYIQMRGKTLEEDINITKTFDFLMSTGNNYFSLSKNQILTNFKYSFKTSFHIKNIISEQPKVFQIQGSREVISYAQRYLLLINKLKNSNLIEVLLTNQSKKIILKILYPQINKKRSSLSQTMVLNEQQYALLEKRKEVLTEVQKFLQQNVQPKFLNNIDSLTKEIISLCRINSFYENQIIEQIHKNTLQGKDILYQIQKNPNEYSQKLEQNYICYLIKKNLTIAFDQTPISLLNYFPQIDFRQKNIFNDVSQHFIANEEQLQEYLKQKKPKPGKNPEESLKTSCSGCFSNYSELFNLIEVCNQCGMRMHQLCQPMQTKCQRCKYIRKTIEEKNHLPYCYICNRQKQQGLAIQFVYQQQVEHFAHTFCLLINRFWTIRNNQICYQKIVKEDPIEQCQICKKQTVYYHVCKVCGKNMHGLCAFLEGCSIFFENQSISIICCRDPTTKNRLSNERKYRLNFEKSIYKKKSVLQI